MKQFLLGFCLLLFATASVMGQPPTNPKDSHTRNVSGSNARLSLEYQKNTLQVSIAGLLQEYGSASGSQKQQIREELERSLFAVFDIGILQKESEVAALRKQIETVKASEAYEENDREIAQLESSLQQVQSSLDFRKNNREQIVAQRLKEILEK